MRSPETTAHDGLPDEFSLTVTRKPDGYWRVTSPGYPGLYIASKSGIAKALADAPIVLATLIRLDAGDYEDATDGE